MKKSAEGVVRSGQKLLVLLEKYKFVLLVILTGVVLLTLPDLGGSATAREQAAAMESDGLAFDLDGLERKLADTLSRVEGAGKVSVALTVKTSTRQVLAQDASTSQKEGETEESRSTVVVSQGSGREEAVPLQQIYPQFQGALVVCAGADDPGIRLAMVEAVSALTGVGSDKISICKGK